MNDAGTSVNGYTGGTAFTNVLSNDTLNGVAIIPSEVVTTFVSSTNPGVTLSGTNVVVAPGTPAGNYTLTYQICEVLNTTNCDQATVTVPVSAAPIIANNDTGNNILTGVGGQSFPNVLINDTLNGNPATLLNVILTQVSTTNSGVTLNPLDGSINITPSTPGGTYSVVYQICEILNPSNCDTATVTVFVEAPSINITKDGTYVDNNNNGITNPGDTIVYNFVVTNTGNVTLSNITITDINATVSGGPLATLAVGASNATTFTAIHVITQADIDAGQVDNLATATGNPPLGPPVTDISNDPTPCTSCTPLNPNCTTCTITPLINAVNDSYVNVSCIITGIAGNILSNDTIGTTPVNTTVPSQVTLTILTGSYPNITISSNGNLTVQSGIAVGTYTFTYKICSVSSPIICDQATVTINIIDTTNPVWTSTLPQNITVSCENVPNAPTLNGTDICSVPVVGYTQSISPGNCV